MTATPGAASAARQAGSGIAHKRTVMIVAGEVSGDIHAGNLLRELRSLDPDVRAFGIGGDQLVDAGLETFARTEELSHMGLVEVLRELPRIRRIMAGLVTEAARRRPALAVLVDSPDFNLRLAARLRRLQIPVVLYISPQLWAWRRGRVRTVRRLAREVLCILPFEVDFYRSAGVPARFVGHPLVDDLKRQLSSSGSPVVRPRRLALLPGSRRMEIQHLLPAMLGALPLVSEELVDEAVLLEAPGMGGVVDEILAGAAADARLRRVGGAGRREELAASAVAWAASGTATLECALLDVPMVVGYRLKALSFALARILVKVAHVSLVNLIAERRVVPELLQSAWSPEGLAACTAEMLAGGAVGQREAFAEIRRRLGGPGASRRAAAAVLEHLAS